MTLDFAQNLGTSMKGINCMALSKLLVLLILVMTACQAAPTVNKPRAHMDYGFEHQRGHNKPVLDLSSDTVKRVKNTVIFEGNAELERDGLVKFLADYISIEFSDDNVINYVVEMKRNVLMLTSAALIIRSEEATSLNFSIYVDFVGNVSISNKGQNYKTDWVRYYFLQGKLQFRRGDFPTRANIARWSY
jgi:hypothetical protein